MASESIFTEEEHAAYEEFATTLGASVVESSEREKFLFAEYQMRLCRPDIYSRKDIYRMKAQWDKSSAALEALEESLAGANVKDH